MVMDLQKFMIKKFLKEDFNHTCLTKSAQSPFSRKFKDIIRKCFLKSVNTLIKQ